MPPEAQVVLQTSQAETQRKTQKDQADIQLAQAKLEKDQQDSLMDNQTKIAIENAKLTHETIQQIAQAQPQVPPVTPAAPAAPQQGAPNGNIG